MSNIFDSFANVVKVTKELEHLPQSARDLFGSRERMGLSSFSWNKHEEWGGVGKWVCTWASAGANVSQEGPKGSKTIGRALLCVDLYRDRAPETKTSRSKLDHSGRSLLTCGFIAGSDVSEGTYGVQYLQFDGLGWPIESDSFIRRAGGRLLEHVDGKQNQSSAKRSWIFTVPLAAIHSPDAFRLEISEPFWSILTGGDANLAFAEKSSACIFPEDGASTKSAQ
jgi:hypothetical protein